MANTVKMKRESDGKEADVHPAEVENMEAAGFEKVKAEAKPKPKAKAKK